MFKSLIEWWNKPSAKERIISALSKDWQSGPELVSTADVWVLPFVIITQSLEEKGIIETRWDRSGLHTRNGNKRKMYRKI